MVFHNHKTLFLHIGKTAGTSVERWLGDGVVLDHSVADYDRIFGYDPKTHIYLQHANAAFARRLLGEELFNSYYKFSVVRNPFERLVSVYYYVYESHNASFGSFENYILKLPSRMADRAIRNGSHHASQLSYTHLDGVQISDYIAHFETLPNSLEPVSHRLGITSELGQANTARFYPWGDTPVAEHYTNEMRDIVLENLEEEFACYGYSTDVEQREPLP